MRNLRSLLCLLLLILGCLACMPGGEPEPETPEAPATPPLEWAIAIHGGAGAPKDLSDSEQLAYKLALEETLALGRGLLETGSSGVDVVEAVIRKMEDQELFNAGRGSVFTNQGTNELDASIMDGETKACGAVTGVTTVKNPITLARKVMENSRHVFFAGEGAEQFATLMEVERVDPRYFFTQRRWDAWQRVLEKEKAAADRGTVGCVVRDKAGNLAAGTSTGGLTNKRWGRIGDSPVVGAGTYASNDSCAVSGTGIGEQFIRNAVAYDICARVQYGGAPLDTAARAVIETVLNEGDGGVIALTPDGTIAMEFNTPAMFRGAATSQGRFEVAIW
ncbi:hypothetical protein ABI59_11440 [Acidobacteria bacterium Mor1]|nr:hypothetical protein ABI59_11440 [Acidobacteria bacterium Mor1]